MRCQVRGSLDHLPLEVEQGRRRRRGQRKSEQSPPLGTVNFSASYSNGASTFEVVLHVVVAGHTGGPVGFRVSLRF